MIDKNELKKHLFILMCYEHYNGLGLVRSLGINGIKPIALILKSDSKLIKKSKYLKEYFEVDNYEQALTIIKEKYSNEDKKPFIYPVDDDAIEIVDREYNELSKNFIIPGAGGSSKLAPYFNKLAMARAAEECGLPFAKTWCVKIGETPKDIIYPVITKPLTSYEGWKSDYYICHDEKELKEAYSKITHQDGEILLQQFIKKENELCLDGLSVNKGEDVFISIASNYTYVIPDYYSMEMIVFNFKDEQLLKHIKKFISTIGYEGIFSIEFLVDKDDNHYFLEINFRNSTWSWASTKLKMNLPIIWAQSKLDGHLAGDYTKIIPSNYIALAEIPDYNWRVVRLKMLTKKE